MSMEKNDTDEATPLNLRKRLTREQGVAYVREFKKFCGLKDVPNYPSNSKLQELMVYSEEYLSDMIRSFLDYRYDNPLPQWADNVVRKNRFISRKTVIMLLDFHNRKIKQHRMRVAKGLV